MTITGRFSTLSTVVQRSLFGSLLLLIMSMLPGCAPGRESLHELEHVQPEHWPSNLNDAAQKIRQRLLWLDEDRSSDAAGDTSLLARRELIEIIGWLPEIAADTDLEEKEWIEIYNSSEQIGKSLAVADATFNASKIKIDALCELLQQKQQRLDALKTVAN